MPKLAKEFFMEVVLRKVRGNVDKYATLCRRTNTIRYTERSNPRLKRYIDAVEGKRIFDELYGEQS